MSQPSAPLTAKHRLGYALGDFGGCMTFALMTAFTTRYYVNIALIDTAVIAVMTLIWKIFDAVSNPIAGILMDKAFARSRDPRGKFRPWILRVTPLLTLSAILVFTAPGWVTGAARLVVAFVTYLMYELFYAIHSIALGGLLSAMATNDAERADLSSARGIGAMISNIGIQVAFPLIISAFSQNPALGYGLGVTVCAAGGFVALLLYYALTQERSTASDSGTSPIRATDILEVFRKNRAFVALCIHGLLQGILMSVGGSLSTYMYADVLGSLALMSLGSILTMPVSLVCMAAVPKLTRKLGSQAVLHGSLLLGFGLYALLFALHLFATVNVWLHMILTALAGGFSGLSNMMQWGMLSEAIEYNEYLTGKRTEGSINGTFNMLRRLGQGLGASFGVALLGLIGYDVSAAVQTGATILGIKVLCLLFPALCALGSWAVFRWIWDITPEVKERIHAAKAVR